MVRPVGREGGNNSIAPSRNGEAGRVHLEGNGGGNTYSGSDWLASQIATWQKGRVRFKRWYLIIMGFLPMVVAARPVEGPAPGTRLNFRALSARPETAPPFAAVDFVYGPREAIGRPGRSVTAWGQWWQVEIRTNVEAGTPPECVVRGQTSTDPLARQQGLRFYRYQVRMPRTGEVLEYVDLHSGSALLPTWAHFEKYFVPRPAETSHRQEGAPETCLFLGHVLSLQQVGHDGGWTAWPDVKRLQLDREVLVGTGRNFKDVEGKRLPQTPQPQDYSYTNFTEADYHTMIEAGMNLFRVAPEQEQWVRGEPVFYVRSAQAKPPLHYPADLFRANYLGPSMFVDEPASVLLWDRYAAGRLTHFSDAAALIEKRTRTIFSSEQPYYGRYWLERQLRELSANLGDMCLEQTELPVWETCYDTAFYEMKGGGSGIVHEARYQLKEFNDLMARLTGEQQRFTVQEMLRWHYAFLRGAARAFGKCWGTAIYGQCDPAIAPEAFKTAYDMGARYFWFWTSDHAHHVPWPEQLNLARTLKIHAREHPRSSIYGPKPKTDKLLLLPDGFFPTYEGVTQLRDQDKSGNGPETEKHQWLVRRTVRAVEECLQRDQDFDIAVNDGRSIKGYRRVLKLSERE